MTIVSAKDIRRFILERHEDVLEVKGLKLDDVPDDFDLMAEGVIDSLGILELISEIESHFGLSIDFEELPAEDLTLIGPLSEFIARAEGSARADT